MTQLYTKKGEREEEEEDIKRFPLKEQQRNLLMLYKRSAKKYGGRLKIQMAKGHYTISANLCPQTIDGLNKKKAVLEKCRFFKDSPKKIS